MSIFQYQSIDVIVIQHKQATMNEKLGTAQEVIQRMQNSRDRGLGVWFNDVPFDEGLEMVSQFCESNEFFSDYNHHDLVDLLCVMDVLNFNAKAPITKLGET